MPHVSTVAAVIMLGIVGVLLWKRKVPTISALLALAAGWGLAGSHGWLSSLLTSGVALMAHAVGWATNGLVGVAVPGLLSVIALIWYVHDLLPKHKASAMTSVLGFMLPTLLAFYSMSDALHTVTSGV